MLSFHAGEENPAGRSTKMYANLNYGTHRRYQGREHSFGGSRTHMIGKTTAGLAGAAWVLVSHRAPLKVLLIFMLLEIVTIFVLKRACDKITYPHISKHLFLKSTLYSVIFTLCWGLSVLTETPLFTNVGLMMLCGIQSMQLYQRGEELAACAGLDVRGVFSFLRMTGAHVYHQVEAPPEKEKE